MCPASLPQNLPLNADKLFLYERFAPFGAILSVKVLTDEETGEGSAERGLRGCAVPGAPWWLHMSQT